MDEKVGDLSSLEPTSAAVEEDERSWKMMGILVLVVVALGVAFLLFFKRRTDERQVMGRDIEMSPKE